MAGNISPLEGMRRISMGPVPVLVPAARAAAIAARLPRVRKCRRSIEKSASDERRIGTDHAVAAEFHDLLEPQCLWQHLQRIELRGGQLAFEELAIGGTLI